MGGYSAQDIILSAHAKSVVMVYDAMKLARVTKIQT